MVLLLVLAATPALSEIRSDQPLAPVVLGAASPKQDFARVASDGSNFFAVWRTRTASNAFVLGGGRLSSAGELLDRPSIFFAKSAPNVFSKVDVVFTGGNFLVLYQVGTSVFTRRFSRDGRAVDSQPVVIPNCALFASPATNGSNVFLPTARDRFRLLTLNGNPVGGERLIPNAPPYSGSDAISVASNGSRYLIAYAYGGGPQGLFVLLTGSGDFLVAKPIPVTETLFLRTITAASNGSSFLIATANNGPVACMFVDADGNAATPQSLDSSVSGSVAATWSGTEYTLSWPRSIINPVYGNVIGHEIVVARVGAGGAPLDTTPVTIASLSYSRYGVAFAAAWNGRDTMIITGDSYANDRDWRTSAAIFKSLPRIDEEPANRRHAPIASSAPEQAGGSIASNGTLSLVTWRESAGLNQSMIRGAFIAADGQLSPPIDLGEADSQTTTAVASNGRDFLVVYFDPLYELVGRRVTLEGVLDPAPIILIPTRYGMETDALAASWSGRAYAIVNAGYDVALSIVTPDGTVARSQWLNLVSMSSDSPAVSCSADGCSVTWHSADPPCHFLCAYTENDVYVRTDALGNLVSRVFLTDHPGVTAALTITATGEKSVFVYSNGKSMFAGRITEAGVVIDTPSVNGGVLLMKSATPFPLQPVAVVRNGLYLVELDDATNGRLYWSRIETEPTPRATSLVNLHQSVTLPLTLTASARNTYLVYSRGEDDAQLMAPRLFLRTIASPDPQTSPARRHAAR
jgi:hypothetical protein